MTLTIALAELSAAPHLPHALRFDGDYEAHPHGEEASQIVSRNDVIEENGELRLVSHP